MKKIYKKNVSRLLSLTFLLLVNWGIKAQLNVSFSGNDVGNPAGFSVGDINLNVAPSVNVLPYAAGNASSNIWSAPVALPFPFNIDGTPVTHYCVNRNGLITFDTTVKGTIVAAALNVNGALPNANIPSPAIACFWGDFTVNPPIGTNDQVWVRTIGTAPNRIHVINYFSFEIESSGFEYMAAILEEGSNKIYIVDTYGSISLSTYTVGVQKNATTAYSTATSPLQIKNGNGSAIPDNEYYTFAPLLATDAGVTAFVSPAVSGCYGAAENVTVTVKNLGANTLSNIPVTAQISGASSGTLTGTLAGPLASGASVNLTLGTYNFSGAGIYSITSYTGLVGDLAVANDTSKLDIRNSSAPYLEDFNASTAIPVAWIAGPGVAIGNTHGAAGSNGIFKNIYNTDRRFEFVTNSISGLNASSQLKYDFRFVNWTGFAGGARVGTILRTGDSVRISISTNGGASYTLLKSYDTTNYTVLDTSGLFRAGAPIALGAYAGQCVRIKFDGVVPAVTVTDFYPDFDNIEITAPAACTAAPVAGTISGPSTAIAGSTFTLATAGSANVTTYTWLFSVNPTGPFTAIPTPNNDSAFLQGPAGTYYFRLAASAPNCPTDSSNVISVVITKIVGDDACDAILLNAAGNYGPYNIAAASVQNNEIIPPATTGSGLANDQTGWFSAALQRTMWFKFVATTKKVKIRATFGLPNGTDNDTQLALWSTTSCDSLVSAGHGGVTLLAANEDSTTNDYNSIIDGSTFCLTPGNTYYVQADPFGTLVAGSFLFLNFEPLADSVATFTGLNADYCVGGAAVTLSATPAGGTFSIGGSPVTSFTPTTAGTTSIVYTFGGCAYTSSQSVNVNNLPTANLPSTVSTCDPSTILDAGNATLPGVTYLWSNGATTQTTTVTTNGQYSVTVTGTGGCSINDTVNVTLNSGVATSNVSAASISICEGTSTTLVGTPSGGVFSANGTGGVFNGTTVGTFDVTYTVTSTCGTAIDTVSITVNANPVTSISASSTTICAGGPTPLTLTGTPAGGTFTVQSGTASALTGNSFNPAAIGNWVIVYSFTNASGCTDTANINFNVNCTVGLNDLYKGVATISALPNPNNGNFDLTINNTYADKATIKLLSMDGRVISTTAADLNQSNKIAMNVSALANGIYFVNVVSGNVNKTIKMTKQD
jgi:hypothetical protein